MRVLIAGTQVNSTGLHTVQVRGKKDTLMNSCNPPLMVNESGKKLHLSRGMPVLIARTQVRAFKKLHLSSGMPVLIARTQVNSTGLHTVQVRGQKDMLMTSCNPPPIVNKSEEKLYICQQVCEYK